MGKTIDLFKKIRYQGNISCKDGHGIKDNKGQSWYGPNRRRRYKYRNSGFLFADKEVKNGLSVLITNKKPNRLKYQ